MEQNKECSNSYIIYGQWICVKGGTELGMLIAIYIHLCQPLMPLWKRQNNIDDKL